MPSNIVQSFADKCNLPVKDVEEKWEKAKQIVKDEYKKSEDDEDFYALVTGVLKKMLSIKESKFEQMIMKWKNKINGNGVGEIKDQNDESMSNSQEIHPLDQKEEGPLGVAQPVSNYNRLVMNNLINIIMDEKHINEKDYSNYEQIKKDVNEFLRTSKASSVIDKCSNRRPSLCAEYLYEIMPKQTNESKNVDLEKELELGINVEHEHKKVYDLFKKLLKKKKIEMPLSLEQFAEMIAKDHLEEMENYYTELRKMENKNK